MIPREGRARGRERRTQAFATESSSTYPRKCGHVGWKFEGKRHKTRAYPAARLQRGPAMDPVTQTTAKVLYCTMFGRQRLQEQPASKHCETLRNIAGK